MPSTLLECFEEIHFFPNSATVQNYESSLQDDPSINGLTGFVNGVNTRNRPVRFDLNATVIGTGIIDGEFGHSVFCELDDFEGIQTTIDTLTNAAKSVFPEYDFKDLVKEDGSLFIKLSHKNGKYLANILPPCIPTSPEKSGFETGARLVITCTINLFANFESKNAGFFLNIAKIVIDGGKKKR